MKEWKAFIAKYDNPDYLLPSEIDRLIEGSSELEAEERRARREAQLKKLESSVEWSWGESYSDRVRHNVKSEKTYNSDNTYRRDELLWWTLGNTSPYDDGASWQPIATFMRTGPFIKSMPRNETIMLYWVLTRRARD